MKHWQHSMYSEIISLYQRKSSMNFISDSKVFQISSAALKDRYVVGRQSERGVSLYIVFMIMTLLAGIGFGMSALLLTQLDTLRGIGYSVLAFYATEAGVERVLYIDQKSCAGDPDRFACLQTPGMVPSGSQPLGNGASYTMAVESPALEACPDTTYAGAHVTYCAKSVGVYQSASRAV